MSLVLASTAAQRWMDGDHMDGWGWVMMAIVLLVVVLLVAGLVYFVVREAGRRPTGGGPDPLEVLQQRFARGEIDEDEYRTRRDVLSG